MHKPKILWIDLRMRRSDLQIPDGFAERCEIKLVGSAESSHADDGFVPEVLCMDFDYPDLPGLRLLQETKQARPSLPLIMITEQHSEALAVWAFRNRVWDYLVSPVSANESQRVVSDLVTVLVAGGERRARLHNPAPPIPNEARFRGAEPTFDNIERAKTFIQKHLATKIQEPVVAAHCEMSPYRFSRVFKKVTGITFQEYVIQQRVKEACRLMQNPNASITDISFTVGFNDPSYFSRVFKRYMGQTPSQYREQSTPAAFEDEGRRPSLSVPTPLSNQ